MRRSPFFNDPVFQRAHAVMLRQLLQLRLEVAGCQLAVQGQFRKYVAMKKRSDGFQALIQV
ncbi:hypothetical protein D3C81_1989950 [compost metagenome]